MYKHRMKCYRFLLGQTIIGDYRALNKEKIQNYKLGLQITSTASRESGDLSRGLRFKLDTCFSVISTSCFVYLCFWKNGLPLLSLSNSFRVQDIAFFFFLYMCILYTFKLGIQTCRTSNKDTMYNICLLMSFQFGKNPNINIYVKKEMNIIICVASYH